jgi:hypothetical protein
MYLPNGNRIKTNNTENNTPVSSFSKCVLSRFAYFIDFDASLFFTHVYYSRCGNHVTGMTLHRTTKHEFRILDIFLYILFSRHYIQNYLTLKLYILKRPLFSIIIFAWSIPVPVRHMALYVFYGWNTGTVGSNFTWPTDVCYVFFVFQLFSIDRGLAKG